MPMHKNSQNDTYYLCCNAIMSVLSVLINYRLLYKYQKISNLIIRSTQKLYSLQLKICHNIIKFTRKNVQ